MFPYMIQGSVVTVVIDNQTHTVTKTHPLFDEVKRCIREGKWDRVKEIIEPKKVIVKFSNGTIRIDGETVYYKDVEMHNSLTRRMVDMIKEEFDITPLVNFLGNLLQNPSKTAVSELYGFLEKNNLPITPDGYFLAFKKVNKNFYDIHSGTVLNKPAYMMSPSDLDLIKEAQGKKNEVTVDVVDGVAVVSMARNEVDDLRDNHCSTGLHFCSKEYLNHFGQSDDPVVILKINPADVVSIPSDYNNSKGRTCAYQVVGVLGVSADDAFNDRAVVSDTDADTWEFTE